ncbi:MAG: hypothetical protein M1821_000479 [Bathelium mastoideum]|nr:MAG: hypothetical protein M1821_000479 [Bathelium mastoideum]
MPPYLSGRRNPFARNHSTTEPPTGSSIAHVATGSTDKTIAPVRHDRLIRDVPASSPASTPSPTLTTTDFQLRSAHMTQGHEPASQQPVPAEAVDDESRGHGPSGTSPRKLSDKVDKIEVADNYGVKVLHNPRSADVDIIFVHGLTGSAYTTWLHKGSGVHGPKDLFPQDLENARIMTFGYDADIVNFWNHAAQDELPGYANDLLGGLAGARSGLATHRRILFVAHSLGGLLIQHALCLSRDSRFSHLQSIERHTIGVCFLGTPHHGSDHADWGSTLANIVKIVKPVNTNLLKILQRGSDQLAAVRDSFHNLLEKRKLEGSTVGVVCFYEQLPHLKSFIVPKESAVMAGELSYPIRANHMNMTKFPSKEDKGYRDVLREIRRLVGRSEEAEWQDSEVENIFSELPTATDSFRGRTTESLKMQQILDPDKPGQKGVVLYGIGGSGKTQLALNFVMKNHRQYSAVLWINASTIQQMNQCFSELVNILDSKWPSPDMPLTYSGPINWKRVVSRLRSTRYSRWLLIIDSIDDLNSKNYRDYIPSCRHGSVIITSTQAQAPEVFRMEPLPVDGLDIQNSSELLLSGISGQTESQEPSANGKSVLLWSLFHMLIHSDRMLAISIAKELNGFPLAIEQAAALIRRTSVSLSNFLSGYRSNYHTLMNFYPSRGLLAYDKNRPVTNIFDMLYNAISVQNPGATALLHFIAILGPWQVPMTVIDGFQLHENRTPRHIDGDTKVLQWILSHSIDLRHALMFLVESCLLKVKYHKDGSWKSISLHRAVCDWCIDIIGTAKRAWIVGVAYELAHKVLDPTERLSFNEVKDGALTHPRDLNLWLERPVAILRPCVALLDRGISLIQRYVPEEDISPRTGRFHQELNFIIAQVAEAYLMEGRLEEAKVQFSRLIDIKRTTQRNEEWSSSKEALQLLLRLANVLRRLGDLDRSRETYNSALSISEKCFGHDDERTGMVYSLLRSVHDRRDVMRLHHKSALIGSTDRAPEKSYPGPSRARHPQENITEPESPPPGYSRDDDAAADDGAGGDQASADLCAAAAEGNIGMVRLLLGLETVDPNYVDREFRTALLWATMRGRDEIVRLLLERNDIRPDMSDEHYRTPLSWAAEQGQKTIVQLLLERQDVNVNLKDFKSSTPLYWAILSARSSVVQLLLEHKDIDVNSGTKSLTPLHSAIVFAQFATIGRALERAETAVNSNTAGGPTPLHSAEHSDPEAIVQLLIKHKDIDVNSKDAYRCQTPLHLLARWGDEAAVQLLLEHKGIDVNPNTVDGKTPLHEAAGLSNEAVVQLLLEHKDIDVNSKTANGQTPLQLAARSGNEATVQLLLEHKDIDVNPNTADGETPLHEAAASGKEAVVQLLLEHKDIDVNSKTANGQTPLHLAADSGKEAVVQILLEHKDIDVNLKGEDSQTSLHLAVRNGHEAVVRHLIRHKDISINSEDEAGCTPLFFAAGSGCRAVLQLLVEHENVDINARNRRYADLTPLHVAALGGIPSEMTDPLAIPSLMGAEDHEAVVRLLVGRKHVDINSKDQRGRTPLWWAAEKDHVAVVQLLINHENINVDSKDEEGRTPLWIAAANGRSHVVQLLVEHGNVDVRSKDRLGRTPRRIAVQNSHKAVARLLPKWVV